MVGALAVALTLYKQRALHDSSAAGGGGAVSDFDQVRYAAVALLQGRDPYAVIGPGREFDWHWPFYYPLSAAVAALPFALTSALAARCLFIGTSAAALAYGLSRRGWHRLAVLVSPWGFYAIHLGQWSPALTAALAMAPGVGAGVALGTLLAIKPTVGAAMLAAVPLPDERRARGRATFVAAAVAVAVLLAASFVVRPHWVAAWLASVRGQEHFRPAVALPGGALALLALLRWRRPEARLLAALACVPQTFWWYDVVPLALVPASRVESLVLAVAGWAAYSAYAALVPAGHTPEQAFALAGRLTVAFAYLPCLLMVLRRPNVGTVPAFLDRVVTRTRHAPGPPPRGRRPSADAR